MLQFACAEIEQILVTPPCGDRMKPGRELKTLSALFLISFFVSTPLRADEMTAGELLSLCTSTDQVASTACRFYVLGVVQGIGIGDSAYMDATPKLVEKKKTIFCLPDNTPQAQMVTIVRDTMKRVFAAYPNDKNLPATSSILAAMFQKFPCSK